VILRETVNQRRIHSCATDFQKLLALDPGTRNRLQLVKEVVEVQGQLGIMKQDGSCFRLRKAREQFVQRRCWSAFSRFVRFAVTAGPGEATKKPSRRSRVSRLAPRIFTGVDSYSW